MEWITIAEWAKRNGKPRRAANYAATRVYEEYRRKGPAGWEVQANTPWPERLKAGWTKGKPRKLA